MFFPEQKALILYDGLIKKKTKLFTYLELTVEEFVDKKTIEFEWKQGFVNFFDFLISATWCGAY